MKLALQSAACRTVWAVLAGLLIVLGVACESAPTIVPVLETASRPTPTLAPSPTPIPTLVPTATPTASPTRAPTPTDTYTPAPTATPTLFPTPTATATSTPQPTPTPTPEPTPTQAAKPVCLPQEKQAISAEHQAVIEEWPESWRPVLDELATFSPAAFQAYTEKLGVYPNAIRLYTTLAYCDQALAVQVFDAPSEVSSTSVNDEIMRVLVRLTHPSMEELADFSSPPLPENDYTDTSRAASSLLELGYRQPETAAKIQGFPWVQRVINDAVFSVYDIAESPTIDVPLSHYAVESLVDIAQDSTDLIDVLIELPWMQDEFSRDDYSAFARISSMANRNADAMLKIASMSFLQTLEEEDNEVLDIMNQIIRSNEKPTIERLFSDEAVADNAAGEAVSAVVLADLRLRNPNASATIQSIPWVTDGLEPSEVAGVLALWRIANWPDSLLEEIVRKPWVQDGLVEKEWTAIDLLETIVSRGRSLESAGYSSHYRYALTIPGKPFMETIEGIDIGLLKSIDRLLQTELRERPDLLTVLLESDQTQTEERSITLPLAGEVSMSVIWPAELEPDVFLRSGVNVSNTMDIMEQAIRTNEEFMGFAFPNQHATILIYDITPRYTGSGGAESFMTVDPEVSEHSEVIVHEVAHTYWSEEFRWITEGAATFMESVAHGSIPVLSSTSCLSFNSVHDFVRLLQDDFQRYDQCNYTLGEALFSELRTSLGEEAFRQSFSDLYTIIRKQVIREECRGVDRGACYLKAAFVEGLPPDKAAIAEEIINRRYYGTSQ